MPNKSGERGTIVKVMSGELAPRTSESKAPVEKVLDGGRVSVEKQPSGLDAKPLSGMDSVNEAVTVSEAARYAMNEHEVTEVAPWNEAVKELRDRILVKMLDSMEGKRIDFSDLQNLFRLADAGRNGEEAADIPALEAVDSMSPKRIENTVSIETQDGILELPVHLNIAGTELADAGVMIQLKAEQSVLREVFPGEQSQIPFDSLRFRIDVGEARETSGDQGIRPPEPSVNGSQESEDSSALRVWSLGDRDQGSLVGVLELSDGELAIERVASPALAIRSQGVSSYHASDAYIETASLVDSREDRGIVL